MISFLMKKVTAPHIYYERYYGPEDMDFTGSRFNGTLAAIANSHQTRTPTTDQPWIISTANAVNDILAQGHIPITSTGINSYEIPLYLAAKSGGKVIVVMPIKQEHQPERIMPAVMKDFQLNPTQTGFYFFRTDKNAEPMTKKEIMLERDRLVIQLADIVYPVSIRRGGNIDQLLRNIPQNRRVELFRVNHELHREMPLKPKTIIDPKSEWDYLTHWTTTLFEPFRGESRNRFYDRIFQSKDGYAYSALNNLKRIVRDGTIKASAGVIRGSTKAISFTELSPSSCGELMTWSAGRVRNHFEPFGIAIKRSALERTGAQPVIYGGASDYEKLSGRDQPYFQSEGATGQWRTEKEWRVLGDITLNRFNPEDILILLPNRNHLTEFESTFPYSAYLLEEGIFTAISK